MLAVVAGGVAYVVLGGQLTELRVADVSRARVVSEVAGLGGAAALVVLLLSSWIGRPRRIASAPGGGAFAGRSAAFKVGGGLYDSSGVDLLKVESSESPANLTPEPPEPGEVSGPLPTQQEPVEHPGVESTIEPVSAEEVESQVDAAVDALIEHTPDPDDEPVEAAPVEPAEAAPVEPAEAAPVPRAPARLGQRPAPPAVPSSQRSPAPGVVELEDATDEVMEVDAILEEVEGALDGMAEQKATSEEADTVVRSAPVPPRIDDDRDTARRDVSAPTDEDMATVARPAPEQPKKRPSPWRRRPVSEYSVRTVKPRGSGPKK
jgi:hypothetical protein